VVKSGAMSYSAAIESFTRALELDPKLAEAHWGLGLAHMGYAHSKEAREQFEWFLGSAPDDAAPEMRGEAEHFLGVLARERGEIDHALACFALAQQLYPRFADTPYERGLTLEGAGRRDEAVAAFRDAVAIDPNHLPSHFRLARLLRQLGDAEGAAREERIHRVLNLLSDDLTGRTTREPETRAELYGELSQLDPKNGRARLEYARALTEMKRDGEAALALDDLLRDRPPLAEAYVLRGEIALRAHDEKRAKEVMESLATAMPQVTAASLPAALRAVFPQR
jgi:Tfp pilus assembly protein PilF